MTKLKSLADRDHPPVPESWHVRCPSCGYDLTGLTVRYCPECDKSFDPVYLANIRRTYRGVIEVPNRAVRYWPLLFALPLVLPVLADSFDVRWFPYRWFWLYGALYAAALLTWFYLRFLRAGRDQK